MAKNMRFYITAGLPFLKSIVATLPQGRTWWVNRSDFEVLCQIREAADESSPLILDLVQYLTVSFDDADRVTIDLLMAGEETRNVTKSGYYDVILSDVGTRDARAVVLLEGPIKRKVLVTAAMEAQ